MNALFKYKTVNVPRLVLCARVSECWKDGSWTFRERRLNTRIRTPRLPFRHKTPSKTFLTPLRYAIYSMSLLINPEKEKLLLMPTLCQGIVDNNYFTFKSLAKKIFP